MENMMNILQDKCKKVKDCLADLLKKSTKNAKELWGKTEKAWDKNTKSVCKKVKSMGKKMKKEASSHREGLMLGAAICSGVIAIASCAGYVLTRKK